MVWLFLFFVLVVFATMFVFFTEYPVITTIVVLTVICIIIISHYNKKHKNLGENQASINLAVKFIEEAYDMAINHSEIEPAFLTLYIKEGVADYANFVVTLFTHKKIIMGAENEIKRYVENALKDYSDFSCEADWQVAVHDDNIYLKRGFLPTITGNRNQFKAEVWDTIKREHPSWSIRSVGYGDGPCIRFD